MKKVWLKIRRYGRVMKALNGFIYDFKRFYSYSAWRENMQDVEARNYHGVKVYHSLEKSMSFKNRNKSSGWKAAFTLLDLLKVASKSGNYGYHDIAAHNVLSGFIELDDNKKSEQSEKIRREFERLNFPSLDAHGTKSHSEKEFKEGMLKSPESFFFSRYSLREFKADTVKDDIIKKAIVLAMKTPSVCNRQAWHVYHTSDSTLKEKALKYQSGNRGFGKKVPNLMIITSDLKAFMSGVEHYQHWIDGGMFSMSIIYALHSIGVASCCLNWSQTPANDKYIRSVVDIKTNHTIIMMIALGWPDEQNKVCISGRRPLNEVFSILKNKEI